MISTPMALLTQPNLMLLQKRQTNLANPQEQIALKRLRQRLIHQPALLLSPKQPQAKVPISKKVKHLSQAYRPTQRVLLNQRVRLAL